MSIFLYIILFSLISSILSVSLAATFLITSQRIRQRLLSPLVSYAAGTLLGAAFLGILPKALKYSANSDRILLFVLFGIILFFILEKLVLWRHCHKPACDVHNVAGPLIIVGDALHNLIDGVVIASSFLVSIPAGIAVSIAVIAHEIPQEIGDFALLLDYGYSRKKAFALNLLSSASTLLGATIAFYTLSDLNKFIPYVLAVSAASFIYIALADILPGLNKKLNIVESFTQLFLLLTGIATIIIIRTFNN